MGSLNLIFDDDNDILKGFQIFCKILEVLIIITMLSPIIDTFLM
jgi:ethanolamine transporter EutH